MTRLVVYILISLIITAAAAWAISLPGAVLIDIGPYRLQPSFGIAALFIFGLMVAAIFVWAIIRRILEAPKAVARRARSKRLQTGYEALADGFIALQAGDSAKARALALHAKSKLEGHAAAQLLEARSDMALGNLPNARENYRALIANPKTSIAALSGLYDQARAQGRDKAALTFARKAHAITPALGWARDAVFDDLTANREWTEALAMLNARNPASREGKQALRHKKAVLHTAIAAETEDTAPVEALEHANAALKLDTDFVPAALIAAQLHINAADIRKAQSILRRVWRATGHPDIGFLFANSRPGASAIDRLKRTRQLIEDQPQTEDAARVLARAAIDAYEWVTARDALKPFVAKRPGQGTCLLMAEIEEGQSGDLGKAREWLSRAVRAPRDPAWVADGIVSDVWEPVSPITGRLDAFEWKAPSNLPATADPVPDQSTDAPADEAKALPPTSPPA